jgi:hypothetical protein
MKLIDSSSYQRASTLKGHEYEEERNETRIAVDDGLLRQGYEDQA